MKINKIKVKNYRSIKNEITIDFSNELVLIGPNNSGKTNFLKAIKLFFDGLKENQYSTASDLPFGLSGEQTSIVITFSIHPQRDQEFLNKFQEVINLLEESKEIDINLISLYLNFSSAGRPNYRFLTNDKVQNDRREEYRRLHEELVVFFLNRIVCNYIPSEKNSTLLFNELLLPHLKKNVGNILQEHQQSVDRALAIVSESISANMQEAGLHEMTCMFGLPGNLFSSALTKFDFFINDGQQTPFHQKGSGVQAATILACLKWITAQENHDGKDVVWLLEEPESYLHPALASVCRNIIEDLSKSSDVFTTTHSMGFIPKNHEKVQQSSINDKNETQLKALKGYSEATQSIRNALGIRFSDYYSLSEYNVFVEGKTDKELLRHVLNVVKPKGVVNLFPALRQASILDFSGVSSLKDFLRSTYSFMAKERSIVVLFDGDDAGVRATSDLRQYFGNKGVAFQSNSDYLILPNRLPIEGLFPIDWLEDLSREHPQWLIIERDAFGVAINLIMPGNHKSSISNWLIERSNAATKSANGTYAWASGFIKIFNILEDILGKKHAKLRQSV